MKNLPIFFGGGPGRGLHAGTNLSPQAHPPLPLLFYGPDYSLYSSRPIPIARGANLRL